MSGETIIPVCAYCGEPITQPRTGRPRIYCSPRCRVAAFRFRRAFEPFEIAQAEESIPRPPAAALDEQIARTVLEATAVAGVFLRLGHEARPVLAWRCERAGTEIAATISRHFERTDCAER